MNEEILQFRIRSRVLDHGEFEILDGEPVKKKLKYLLKEFTPASVYQNKLDKKFESAGNKDFRDYLDKYRIFADSVQFIRSFELPLNEHIFTSRPDIMPVYLSLAYFLFYLSGEGRLSTDQFQQNR